MEPVDQPPLLSPLKCLFDHLERATPLGALDLIGHGKKDTHQLVDRIGKAIIGIVGAAQHALGDPMFLVAPCVASGLVHHQGENLASRSEEHTSELQSLMRISYAVFCLKKKKINSNNLDNNYKMSK